MKQVIDFGNELDKRKLFEILKSRKKVKHIVEIKIAREIRSNLQNKYYWVVMGIIGEHCGYRPEEMHELMKLKFLGFEEKTIKQTGEVLKSIKSTKELQTNEFSNYIENIRLWALQDLDCYVCTPEEFDREQIELTTKYL